MCNIRVFYLLAITVCFLFFSDIDVLGSNSKSARLFICANETNDLYVLLEKEDYKVNRYDTANETIEKATAGSAVIITAINYPENRTAISQDLYNKARQKKLKLYIEFPEFIPNIKIGKENYKSQLERAVITSTDFFNNELYDLQILGINSSYIVPVNQKVNSIISFAKVAGYNKADYGLTNTTVFPLLFTNQNVLVATTNLSNFKTGSYRPSNSWKNVWSYILQYLIGGKVELNQWETDPKPTYTEKEIIPANARYQSIARGSDWFFKSKFIIDPYWYPNVIKTAGDGSHPVGGSIPESWMPGNGRFGILEGHVSNVQANGKQDIRYMIRNDVQGETAFALASAGKILGNDYYLEVSRNLLDFLFFTSNSRKGFRNDKNSPAYGMLGWADTTPYYFYNDDHARLVLGSLGAIAHLNDSVWNKRIIETILTNFRVSSKEGFIGNRLTENELLNNGWEHYNKRTFISPHPHFESWIWACYLWLYDKTGYEPLLKKAKKAIEITMNAYPKLWKWTNGIQQERARMILPLAWLVRVEDIPEHREWLNYMVDELLRFQQPSGAIREELGTNNMGQHGATTSNAEYGDDEAPLIAKNGDPASDMLYTSNFAFFALNEAAQITEDIKHKQAVDKLADFLVRIQVKSKTHKDIDGSWFRGFDYKEWDYWGSNADEEWGVWCTLTGWIQSWIVGTLILVEDNNSLWNLTKNINVNKDFSKSLWMLESAK